MENKKTGPAKRPGGLGDLGKALREAGILSEEKAKTIAHEERVRKKEIGREKVEEEKRQHEAQVSQAVEGRRAEARAAQSRHEAESDSTRVLRLVREGTLPSAAGRAKRFHFVSANRRVPFLEIDDETTRQVVQGAAGIVEVPGSNGREHVVVTGRDRLAEIEKVDAALVRFWNKVREPRRDSRPAPSPAAGSPAPAPQDAPQAPPTSSGDSGTP